MAKLEIKFLGSKVGRRILVLFILCALLPITALTTISFYQVSGQLRAQTEMQLRQASKSEAMAIFERLLMLNAELNAATLRAKQDRSALPSVTPPGFLRFSTWAPQGGSTGESNLGPAPKLSPAEKRHLLSGKSLLRVVPCAVRSGQYCVLMMRLLEPGQTESPIVVGEVDPAYLWFADRLSTDMGLAVSTAADGCFFHSDPVARAIASQALPAGSSSGFVQSRQQGKSYDAAYWSLLLRPRFFADSWTIVMSQNEQQAFAPMQHFRHSFALVILLAVLVVLLLSLIQIRRTLVPLEELRMATQQIASQHFDSRVEISSGDEFQDLAGSFNTMASRLAKQFQALKTMNEIDKSILSSLKHETVISEALGRISNLLPSDIFGLVVFKKDQMGLLCAQVTVGSSRSPSHRRLRDQLVSSAELKELEQSSAVQILEETDRIPAYLLPMKQLGMRTAFVFPIFLEQRVFAALVCGTSQASALGSEDVQHARQVADQLAVAFSNVELIDALEQLHWGTLTALARAIDAKSAWTAGHSERVTRMALRIGSAIGLSARDLQIIHRGGLVHDVGKIGTPPEVLDKPGPLDGNEMQTMRDHVKIGVRILEPIGGFKEAMPVVAQHHEWFDGSGYPAGLKGEAISLHARIFAVADCYDAMISDRPYRKGLPRSKVIEVLKAQSGRQFDPKVIEVFVRLCAEDENLSAELDSRMVEQVT
jgi:putative nucleotidyltransferase with HDIG domain